MMPQPFTTDIVLIGGGHAHVEVLRSFAMAPLDGVRLTVVARDTVTPYSGMLPGYLAGLYSHAEAHIDLRPLCARAGARLIHAPATGLDPNARTVSLGDRPPLHFDLASIDIGSTPVDADITGAGEHGIPVKPVERFLERWQAFETRAAGSAGKVAVAIVGGGAGGVEVCLGLRHRLAWAIKAQGGDTGRLAFALVTDSDTLLPRHGAGTRRYMAAAMRNAGITVHHNKHVSRIDAGHLTCDDGSQIESAATVLVTGAAAASWLAGTGLARDDAGFISVDASLRSTSHPFVLACGDIASFGPQPLVKNGVYAVRQGPFLARTLRRLAKDLTPQAFRPQHRTLALITTGERHAIASWGNLAFRGDWVWRWKDWIDRRWMKVYQELPSMADAGATPMRCGGCGAKVPASVLKRALARLDLASHPDVVIGLDAPDDAAVLQPLEGSVIIQTVDQFPAFIDDPYVFGRITAVHALSDIHAMGAKPAAALALAGLLPGTAEAMESDLVQMLEGILSILREENCALAGGHTSETERASLGLSVTGFASPTSLIRKGGLKPGDALILTRPLGTGVLFAADMQGEAKSAWIEEALAGMQRSNGPAARILIDHGVTAMTDVTGFGLAGHLLEMLQASGVGARLQTGALPAYTGAVDLLARGIASTLHPGNVAMLDGVIDATLHAPMLFDPQTAGGLLAGIAREKSDACLSALQNGGDPAARIIGEVTEITEPIIVITS
ncbi:MAG: selenide, water dikinase SelD [Alphaproteobacteria bacterium]|jgi:selenide, water dikinase|nr:selenide, water dikinase SelD [Rhodospirillaceae bacterium]MBT6509658.1 selenide, water dikinase SelD [Rhodospirillaceae bacterium]MBT7646062.1 selenide, water dikinase SelD [Rhodospirillaceae bacterium]MDG2480472.1 selenide, water dikinase SelD [Alphaproteobacteria bacterium]